MKTKPFPEGEPDTTTNPYIVKIITDRDGTDEGENTEDIILIRELTPLEEKRLMKSETPGEVRELLENIRNINAVTEYEVDLRTR